MQPFRYCLSRFAVIALCASVLSAQVETTTAVSGTVRDSSGQVVAGVPMTLQNQATGALRNTTTNMEGVYSFPSLLAGTYTITATAPGFRTAVVADRVVENAQPAIVDFSLEVGSTSETVTVSAKGAELVNTASAEVTGLIPAALVKDIPLPRGNFFDLLQLTPQVVPQNITLASTSFAAVSLNFVQSANTFTASGSFIAGNRDSANNVSVDGSNVQLPVYQQAVQLQSRADVQEVRVETASMSAEFGSGVAAVNVITKAGTNQYHGELYEYLRNSKLDATPYFTNLIGKANPPYTQNQFGAAAGGPIRRDKLLFFGNYEGFQVRQSSQSFEAVPDLNLRNGNFASSGTTVYNPYQVDPATGQRQPFPDNRIPLGPTSLCAPHPTCVDPATLAYLQKYVLPPNSSLNGIPQYTAANRTIMGSNQYTGRLDWLKSSTTTVYGRYTYTHTNADQTGLQPLEGTFNSSGSQNAVIHYTHVFSASTVNDAMASYARPFWNYARPSGLGNAAQEIGIANTSIYPGGPSWSVPGYNLGNTTQYFWNAYDNTYQLKDDVSTSRGTHLFKFGAEATNRRFVYYNPSADKGSFTFANIFTQACPQGSNSCLAGLKNQGLSPSGNAFGDFLLGAFTGDLLIIREIPYVGHQTYLGFYALDQWRATPRLTINYGLRYEYWSPWLVPRNTTESFNFKTGQIQYALQNPFDYLDRAKCFGACAPLNPGVPRESYRAGNKDFAPRIGLAYSVTPQTVLRLGAGIYFDGNINMNQLNDIQSGAAPYSLRQQTANDISQAPQYLTSQQFAATNGTVPQPFANPLATFRFIEGYMPTPVVYQWSASVQHRLGQSWGLEMAYIGSHTIHEFQFLDVNAPALPTGPLATVPLAQREPYPQWGVLGTWAPIGWAKYHAGTISVKNNEYHGLTLTSNFTWAKNLVSSLIGTSDDGNTNFRNPYLWTGRAVLTPPVWFISALSYRIPSRLGDSSNAVLRAAAGGWSVSSTFTASAGSPEPVTTTDLTGTNLQGPVMPNRICNPNSGAGIRTRLKWFNTGCFVDPAYGVWGNSTIGVINDPGINNWNISASKLTKVFESHAVEFRADFLNAFNHTQWGPVDKGVHDLMYGQITSTRPPRQIQLALRYQF